MYFRIHLYFLSVLLLTGTPAAAEQLLVCESKNYSYQYCRADTKRGVELGQEYSKRNCIYGQSWGYDTRGIWVDRGCRAGFSLGGRRIRNDYGGNIYSGGSHGITYPDGGGIRPGGGWNPFGYNHGGQGGSYGGSYGGGRCGGAGGHEEDDGVPRWAVGSFNGYDGGNNRTMRLVIQRDGDATLRASGGSYSGHVRGSRLYLDSGGVWSLYRTRDGFEADRQRGQSILFRRANRY